MLKHATAVAAVACALAVAGNASADFLRWDSTFSPEAPGATGSGSVSLVYDTISHELAISTQWSGLSGVTTVAHIHCCVAPPGTVGVAVTPTTLPGFPTGVSFGNYSVVVDLDLASSFTTAFVNNFGGGTIAGAQNALLAGFHAGTAYFNIHTNNFPGGEIRGFLVPEPASLALLGLGLAALGFARRRR